ncbi:MAG: ATP-dependent 6-phosphofructokinase [Candidatus Omnitrophica bacterium]|nr:ATP-dependent 6-phosphofructokinase [Candidatus Omnitrophota bacterium]MDD5437129.1 ATP-dependent 6-phosphofructokinase [Candidatus Omnitrophota bacterium]
MRKRIGILSGGGDCPGINAVIRAVAKKAMLEMDAEIIGIEDGYEGLVNNKYRHLELSELSGILTLGGTILGTSKKANPYRYAIHQGDNLIFKDLSRRCLDNIEKMELDCLVCIGGDGTLSIAYKLFTDGVPVIGVPKTIDNDILGTDITFGFDSAVWIATEGIDRLHTTAQSHHRVMIVEVMGHNAGWLSLHSGVAGGGDIILIPEIPYDIDIVAQKVKDRNRRGKRFSIIVVAEGAKAKGGDIVIRRIVKESSDPIRLGGIGFVLGQALENATKVETRTVVMGHLQRGGSPTPYDRVLATQLGTKAVDMIKKRQFGHMVGVQRNEFIKVSLKEVSKGVRKIPLDNPLIASARSLDTSFGDKVKRSTSPFRS